MKRLIINADDFGLTQSVNEAIIDVYRKGNLTSATMMVNMPGLADAVNKARENKELGIGLHFCITQGKPVSGESSLTDAAGNFHKRKDLLKEIITGRIKRKDIRKEFESQIELFRLHLGKPDHVDSHQHIHMNPWIFFALLSQLRKHNLKIRLIDPPLPRALFLQRPFKAFKQSALFFLSRVYRPFLKVQTNDYLVSIHESKDILNTSKDYYKDAVNNVSDNTITELMVHPYRKADDLKLLYTGDWEDQQIFLQKCFHEYDLMMQENLFEHHPGIKLIRYGDI